MKLKLRTSILVAIGWLAFGTAFSADYPTRSIRYMVGSGPGSLGDIASRIYAEKLSSRLRQPVVVDLRPGAGGLLAWNSVLSAEPDGYTILGGSSNAMTYPSLVKDFKHDLAKDVTQITISMGGRVATFVSTAFPARNMDELVAYMNANPGKVNVGTVSSWDILQTTLFRSKTGTKYELVRYPGPAPMMNALVAGDIHVILGGQISMAKPLAEAGKLRIISVHGTERDFLIPAVPALSESSIPQAKEIAASALYGPWWLGPMASSRVPREAVNILYAATRDVLKDPDLAKRLRDVGVEVFQDPPTPEEATARVVKGAVEIGRIAKEAGIQPQ